MTQNLNEQYDHIIVKLTDYYRFERNIRRRVMNPINNLSIIFNRRGKRILQGMRLHDDVVVKQSPFTKEMYQHLATSEEIKDPKFQIITSDYPIDALSKMLESTFTDYDFDSLATLHKSRVDGRAKIGPSIRNILGLVFGVGSIILQFTPETVVKSFDIEYDNFQTTVFWVTVGAVAYIGFIVSFAWFSEISSLQRMEFISKILEYTSLRLK